MAFSMNSISRGRRDNSIRAILLGPEKAGKSTFGAGAPSPIFIPVRRERGLSELDVPQFPPVGSISDLIECLNTIYQGDHSYQTLVIDSSSALEPVIWGRVCEDNAVDSIEKVGKGYGKGYTESLRYWHELIEGLDAIWDHRRMNIIIIGHVVTREVNDPETEPYTAFVWDIHRTAQAAMMRWADAILFANFRRASVVTERSGFDKTIRRGVGTDERRLYTQKRPHHPGGTRYRVPYEMELSWSAFANHVSAGRQAIAEGEDETVNQTGESHGNTQR